MLGNIIIPYTRLEEFRTELQAFNHAEPWNVSLLWDVAGKTLKELSTRVSQIDEAGFKISSIETKGTSVDDFQNLQELTQLHVPIYIELAEPLKLEPFFHQHSNHRFRAKIRTGGVTQDKFPSADAIIEFIEACFSRRIPFKATAGLHHIVCGAYPLTYEQESAVGRMYGYLNLLLASAAIVCRRNYSFLHSLLRETDIQSFRFEEVGIRWRDEWFPNDLLNTTRSEIMMSFGSCSIIEPIAEAILSIP